ncbi:MAG: STAS domain-containing protein [Salibacteraceae bacterium]
MSFDIQSRQMNDVTILDLSGKLTIAHSQNNLRKAVQNCLSEGQNKLILDMEGLQLVDSTGIGEVISSYTSVTNGGGKLALCNVQPKVMQILKLTRLDSIIQIAENLESAFNSMN